MSVACLTPLLFDLVDVSSAVVMNCLHPFSSSTSPLDMTCYENPSVEASHKSSRVFDYIVARKDFNTAINRLRQSERLFIDLEWYAVKKAFEKKQKER
jgi:hypothetical protein